MLFGLGVFVVALWAQSDTLVGVFYDDGIYVTAAKALAEGHGYRNIHLPDAPPVVHYPPLYAWMLALAWRIWPAFPQNVALFQLLDAMAVAGAAWVIARHARHLDLGAPTRYAALALGFTAFPLLSVMGMRLSEPVFLLLAAGAIALADRAPLSSRAALAAGALAGAATLARTVGVCVIGGVVIALWLRRERRAALLALATAAVLVLPWPIWVALHAGQVDPRLANYTTYLHEASQAGLGAILSGLRGRALTSVLTLTLPRVPEWVFYPLGVPLLVLLVWGGVDVSRRAPALIAWLACYLLMVSLWPYAPHRFVWIILPWLALLLAAGCREAWRRPRWGRWLVAVALGASAVGYLPREFLSLAERRFTRTALAISQPFRVLTASIAQETPQEAVIAAEDEALVYLYTGRRTVPSHLFRWSGLGTTPLPAVDRIAYWCERGVTHLSVTAPQDPANAIVEEMSRQGAGPHGVVRLFQIAEGPGLYRFACPR